MRFSVLLTRDDFDMLARLAREERRDTREQAAFMLSRLLRATQRHKPANAPSEEVRRATAR
jgi:hypothetical protein